MNAKLPSNRRGLIAGGNWIVDHVKVIDAFPSPTHLARIHALHTGTGGSPYNVLVTLARCGARFPLAGAGLLGRDAAGADVLAQCAQLGIETKLLHTTPKAATAFTDVMTESNGVRRTFFHAPGANALWAGDNLDFAKLRFRWFHLGYLGLLDALDAEDDRCGTRAARLLAAAQAAGLKTSVDVASVPAARLTQVVPPALKFTDYLILNETEAGRITGFHVRDAAGRLDPVALRHATGALLQLGVREMVVLHFPEGAFARTRRGEDVWQSAVKLPPKLIAGTAGAGDAFCAGCLLGLHEGWETKRFLEAGACLAAACLTEATCTGGIHSLNAALALGKKHRYQPPLEPGEF